MILTDERFKKTKLICNENYERMRGMQMEVAGFLALGILVGLLGALLGIGGGMVIVPLLVFAWDYEPQLAIGTSVLMVLMNAVSGTWGYIRQKKVCVDAALKFAVATVPGARGHCYFYLHFGSFLACRLSFACYAWAYCVDQRSGDWCGCLCRCSGRCSFGAKAAVRHFDEAGECAGADYRH